MPFGLDLQRKDWRPSPSSDVNNSTKFVSQSLEAISRNAHVQEVVELPVEVTENVFITRFACNKRRRVRSGCA
jgi:hypothetical protein